MTICQAIKKQKHSKLTCPYCKVTFSQKFNRDRHVKNIHQEDTLVFIHDVTEADQNRGHSIIKFSQNDQSLDPLPLVRTCSTLVTPPPTPSSCEGS